MPLNKAELDKKLAAQMQAWRDDLLSIDRRQKLVYFQHPKSGTFEIVDPGCLETEARINKGGVLVDGDDDSESGAARTPSVPANVAARKLTAAGKTSAQVLSTCKRLHQRSEQEYADRGVWTLYIAYGMLNWMDPADSKSISSPLLLVPVRLTRDGQNYRIDRTEDEPTLNTALALKLSRDFGVRLPELDDEDLTAASVFGAVRSAVAKEPNWTVDERVVLSIFSFHKEAMYRDLEENESRITSRGLIQLLAVGPESPSSSKFPFDPVRDEDLDGTLAPEKLHSILDADGSQRKCILAARDGHSFIMDGPPGTGKSQTIANMIAELMAVGKTVLFVSEKAAALDVVRDRLAQRQMEPFLLELHSHKATRKHVVQTLHAELTRRPMARSTFSDTDRSQLIKSRTRLSDYAEAMNEIRRPLGRSLHEVLGRLSQLADHDDHPAGSPDILSSLTADVLAEIKMTASSLAQVWRPAEEGEYFPWTGLDGAGLSQDRIKELERVLQALSAQAERVSRTSNLVDSQLPFWTVDMDINGVRSRSAVVKLLTDKRSIPHSWYVCDLASILKTMDSVEEREKQLDGLESEVNNQSNKRWVADDRKLISPLNALLSSDPKVYSSVLADCSLKQMQELHETVEKVARALHDLAGRAGELGKLFNLNQSSLTLNKCRALAALAELSQQGSLPEADWINASIQGALDESARVLGELASIVCERQSNMESVFRPEILALDIKSLKARFETQHKGMKRWSKQAREDRRTVKDVSVAGVANKDVIGMLGGALAWQIAQYNLTANEAEYGPRLGSYYQGPTTDFSRIAQALEVARTAIRLAGQDVGPPSVARQLSRSATPDVQLMPLAREVTASVSRFEDAVATLFDHQFLDDLSDRSLDSLSELLGQSLGVLDSSLPVRERLAVVLGGEASTESARNFCAQIEKIFQLEAAAHQASVENQAVLGRHFSVRGSNWAAMRGDHEWISSLRQTLGGPLDEDAVRFIEEFDGQDLALEDEITGLCTVLDHFLSFFEGQRATGLRGELERDLSGIATYLESLSDNTAADVDLWFEFKKLCGHAKDLGLSTSIHSLAEARVPASQVAPVLERAALEPWAESIIAGDVRLSEHRASSRDGLLDQFRELDSKLVSDAHSAVIAACVARRPRSFAGPAAIIAHEANKKTRHKPIRRLLDETSSIVQAIKPCFMMSPLSVSQYIPPSMEFDVVIFDEASQVMPADAVNCIYRGKQLIVAGDQKQLPPTSFFSTAEEEADDNDELPDNFDSVLDLCKASGAMVSLPLLWHYRSLHEDLITYSNYRIYAGKLHTFPGATQEANDLGVHHEFVHGIYQRGAGSRNPIEAERVVDRVLEHRRLNPDLSLGVVTFSNQQAEAVSEAIERRAEQEPLLTGLMEDHDRLHGFFVKNLESVQGDERDIIIFSVGYGPDEAGRLTMNFGPLTRKGGERRLNVAVTRARRRVEVVSSFRAGDMTDGTSEGNMHLKNYLDFAERGRAALSSDMSGSVGEAESPFEEEVLKVIRSWGFDAVPQVGAAGYRIDIGVRHPGKAGTFMLGIECDGAAYHSAKTARDRDRLREAVLRGLGWDIHRIWGLSWYRDRASHEHLLKDALEGALRGTRLVPAVVGTTASPEFLEYEEVDLSAPPAWTVPYAAAARPPRRYRYQPGDLDALNDLVSYASHVVGAEAPLHVDTFHSRLRDHWETGGVGTRVRANVERALSLAKVSGMKIKLDKQGFIRIDGAQSVNVRRPTDENDVRKAGTIPPEEFDEAVRLVVADAIVITEEDLYVAVRNVFGWARRGSDIQAALQRSLVRAVKKGYCVRRADGTYETTQV